MRIKKLEIVGFKSFADKARLQFGDGITGVVGPNGCGKSNVVDAIRWCMGEMSAKHLRGRAMQDVIFAGSDSRGPQGFAEVTLTFANEDGNVPPTYQQYTEIAVTRRLYRDGSSEYLINKVPVRLRDVTDLFLGTGVGTRAYSIIEQGRIGFVVNSRPEDRRSLIEEVAGITKFKARKKAAERRMEATEQNLLRVNDVVSELERQLGTLRRQAKKAERYKEARTQLRDLDLHLAALEWLRLHTGENVQRQSLRETEAAIADTQAGLSADETGLEADRLRLFEEESRLQALQEQSASKDAELAGVERDLKHWRSQAGEAQTRREQALRDASDATRRREEVLAEGERMAVDAVEQDAQASKAAAQISDAQRLTESLQEELAIVDEELEGLRREAMQHVQGATQSRTVVASLERQRADLDTRLGQARREQDELLPRQAQARVREADLAERRDALCRDLDAWREEQQGLRGKLPDAKETAKASAAALSDCKESLSERRSRLASLEEIARRLDGYSDGVRMLMGDGVDIPGLSGLVTQVFEVQPVHEQAIEAVLGERLQYLIVEEMSAAEAAIAHLKEHQGGRGGFIPATMQARRESATFPTGPGVLGGALEHVNVAERYENIAQDLLGNVVLVDTLATALAQQKETGGEFTWVSLDGEVVDASGVASGGSANGAGLLANRREIRELQVLVAQLEETHARVDEEHRLNEQTRLQLETDIQQLDKDIHASELERVKLVKDHEACAGECKRLTERLETLAGDAALRSADLERLEAEEQAAVKAAEIAESGKQDVEWRLTELQERRHVQATQLRSQTEQLTALKVGVAAQQEKATAARATAERLQRTAQELEERAVRAREAAEASQTQDAELNERIATGDAQCAELAAIAGELHGMLADMRNAYETERERQAALERTLKEQRRGSDKLADRLMEIRIELQKLALAHQNLAEQTLERHDMPISEVVTAYHMRPMPTEKERRKRDELDRQVKSMGPINLTAIEECQEVETRYTFLTKQRDDLQVALNALRTAITRINRTSRERFKEAFDAVNEMFQKVYPRLFRGGVARLELTNSDDLLEAGVDIIAMPPGKKLQNVQLLSGGEKALTATALVFSIFLIKPSPFCILDEVDAPLDEANVNRFNEMLREISKVSQFIVITHNKQTMLQVDRIYGITMEEPGMSKVVAVDLQDKTSGTGEEAAA